MIVEANRDAAISWYTEAATQLYAKAQNNLGFLYYIGSDNGTSYTSCTNDFPMPIIWSSLCDSL